MRTIRLNKREARLLRDNLVGQQSGYDYLDLVRLDALARRLTEVQGEYGERLTEIGREEKAIRRQERRGQITAADANRLVFLLVDEVEELDEAAETEPVELAVEDGDWKLIKDKLDSQPAWTGQDSLRHLIIGMVKAVNEAEGTEPEAKVKNIRG